MQEFFPPPWLNKHCGETAFLKKLRAAVRGVDMGSQPASCPASQLKETSRRLGIRAWSSRRVQSLGQTLALCREARMENWVSDLAKIQVSGTPRANPIRTSRGS